MTEERIHAYNTGDLVKKSRHGETMAGLVLEGINSSMVRVIWETGTASIEIEDDLTLIATSQDRGKYLIEGDIDTNE